MAMMAAFRPSVRGGLAVGASLVAGAFSALPWPMPAAYAASSPPALTIVSTWAWRESGPIAAVHVVGEVRNDDAVQTAQDIMVDCRLVDAGGGRLAEGTMAADAAALQPA